MSSELRPRASSAPVILRGPSRPGEVGVPLVPDLRSVALSRHPVLESLRDRTGSIAQEALRLARVLTSALPAELTARPEEGTPSLWECFQYEFARYSLAPALMNLEIARQALAGGAPSEVRLQDRATGAWWLGGSGAGEAARQAAREQGRRLTVSPGALARRLRQWLITTAARRAPQPMAHCYDCEHLSAERLSEEPCEVLFLSVAATSAPIIAQISQALEAQGVRSAALDLHFAGSTEALRRTAVRVIDGRPALYGGSQAAQEVRSNFRRGYRQARAGVHELVGSGELPAWLAPVVEMRLAVALARDLPELAAFRRTAQIVLDTLRPQGVVGFHTSADFLSPFLLAQQIRQGATAWCQHGIRGPVHRNGVILPWGRMLCFGQYTADLYADLVGPDTDWIITGNCLYDDLVRTGLPEAEPVRERLGLAGKQVVLAATQSDEPAVKSQQPRWWLRGVAEACSSLGARLLIKMHPAETSRSRYEELLSDFPEVTQIFTSHELDLREALAAAEVLVTRDSTVVYEAALAGKPALTINLPPYLPRFALAEQGGALGVYAYQEIEPALRELLQRWPAYERLAAQRGQFLEYHLGPQDGRATERLVAALATAPG